VTEGQPPPLPSPCFKHGIQVAPPASAASPHTVDAEPGEDVPWWKPGWGDVFRHLGWRWLWFTPAAAIVLSLALLPLRPSYAQILFTFWKPIVVAVVVPSMMAVHALKTLVRQRNDPFCIHCGYSVVGLPDGHRCPECGRKFSLAVIEEYRRDPHWFVERWKARHAIPQRDAPFSAGAVRSEPSRDGT
jgi:hypothetical protein